MQRVELCSSDAQLLKVPASVLRFGRSLNLVRFVLTSLPMLNILFICETSGHVTRIWCTNPCGFQLVVHLAYTYHRVSLEINQSIDQSILTDYFRLTGVRSNSTLSRSSVRRVAVFTASGPSNSAEEREKSPEYQCERVGISFSAYWFQSYVYSNSIFDVHVHLRSRIVGGGKQTQELILQQSDRFPRDNLAWQSFEMEL